ncbi:hypothetical protein ACSYDW_10820 [Paeniglutamicibacter sp. R2-26]|uniref:hypothetical protein n=1 Tax=Paeniglutamicibacter sp. R2-26 TaxID=3144417 RepID=UPI003EE6739C
MSSQKMFRVGLVLGIIGLLFNVVVSPLLNWSFNEGGYVLPLWMVSGLTFVVQQGSFYAGLFLLAGSFVVKSAEEAVEVIRKEQRPRTAGDQE